MLGRSADQFYGSDPQPMSRTDPAFQGNSKNIAELLGMARAGLRQEGSDLRQVAGLELGHAASVSRAFRGFRCFLGVG